MGRPIASAACCVSPPPSSDSGDEYLLELISDDDVLWVGHEWSDDSNRLLVFEEDTEYSVASQNRVGSRGSVLVSDSAPEDVPDTGDELPPSA